MNKADLITIVSDKAGLTKKDTTVVVDALLETITETLAEGESVSFIGFGSFSTSDRAARDGVNPSTGAKIQIAASRLAKFKAGSKLREAVKLKTKEVASAKLKSKNKKSKLKK